jgi:hypothetical protein
VHTDLEEWALETWEQTCEPHGPGDDDLLPWTPGDGFPDGNDPLRGGAALHALDGGDDEAPSPSWEDLAPSDGR